MLYIMTTPWWRGCPLTPHKWLGTPHHRPLVLYNNLSTSPRCPIGRPPSWPIGWLRPSGRPTQPGGGCGWSWAVGSDRILPRLPCPIANKWSWWIRGCSGESGEESGWLGLRFSRVLCHGPMDGMVPFKLGYFEAYANPHAIYGRWIDWIGNCLVYPNPCVLTIIPHECIWWR